jgi:hypothetical protein
MFGSHVYLWPLAVAASGAIVAGMRCGALLIGLRWTLKAVTKADRLAAYREFARALSPKGRPHNDDEPSGPRRTP